MHMGLYIFESRANGTEESRKIPRLLACITVRIQVPLTEDEDWELFLGGGWNQELGFHHVNLKCLLHT